MHQLFFVVFIVDEDQFVMQHLFLDVDVISNDKEILATRIARQEPNDEREILMSVREGHNV
ncbi:hypothetical protein ACK2M7_11680 [Chryseobacterium sp. TY4]